MSSTRSMDLNHRLGLVLHQLRIERGLALETVADVAGITPRQLARIEQGLVAPAIPVLVRMAHQFGMTLTRISELVQLPELSQAATTDVAPRSRARSAQVDLDQPPTAAQLAARETARARAVEFGFTPREQDIAVLLVSGVTTASGIAQALGNQPQTVKNIMHAIFVKAGTTDRVQLALRLLELW